MRKLIKSILPEVGIGNLKIRSRGDNRCESANWRSLATLRFLSFIGEGVGDWTGKSLVTIVSPPTDATRLYKMMGSANPITFTRSQSYLRRALLEQRWSA